MFLSYQNNKIVGYTEEPQDLTIYNLEKVEETDLEYILDGEEYVLKDEAWEEKQAQKERERRNQEIDNKIKELYEMASTEMVKGNDLNVETYKAVIKSLEESKV